MPERTTDDRLFTDVMGDLPALRDAIWEQLEAAASGARHGWHLPMVGTGGTQPHVRTVVLRHTIRDERTLAFHTDVRSPKITQMRVTPHVSWCFYDAANRVQLVADGTASIHTDDPIADAGWERSSASSRRCYLAPAAPGAELDEAAPNLPEDLIGKVPSLEATAPGRENFAVVRTRVQRLDFLFLSHEGNLRAEFLFDGEQFAGQWIAA